MGHSYEYFETSFLGLDNFRTTKYIEIEVIEEIVVTKRKIISPIIFI